MNKYVLNFIMASFIIALCASSGMSEDKKIAQTGMKFLSVSTDARLSAMGSAVTSLENGKSTALFYNPASMADANWTANMALGQTQWIADINYIYGSAAFRPQGGQFGVFGVSFISVDYGDLYGTIRAENEQGFIDIGTYSPSAYALGFGYAKALSNKFSVGGQAKYVNQNLVGGLVDFVNQGGTLDDFEQNVWAFDFGILYKTGFKSLNLGMNVRNFSREIEYIQESFQLPLTFEMGISINAADLIDVNPETHSLIISMDAVHPRDYSEQIDLGFEYTFLKSFAIRMGYTSPTDEQGISLGAGFNQTVQGYGLNLDYGYTNFGVLEDIHRFTVNFTF